MKLGRKLRGGAIGVALAGVAVLTTAALSGWPGEDGLRQLGIAGSPGAASPLDALVQWDLPAKRTDRVAYWEGVLSGPRREKMQEWLEQSGRYVPMIRQKLRARGMPEDLVYLALAESGFSPNALSRTRAVGLWQLMEQTGRDLGLRVTSYVDQRRDPLASTDAALDFLTALHDQFGSWWLAAAAYNCGPNRVARVLREVTGQSKGDDDTYWRIAPHLPKETQDYVPLILAEGAIAKDPARFGFTDLNYHAPLHFDSVRVPGGTRLATVSRATGVDSMLVHQLNPHYVRSVTPPVKASDWVVRIPVGLTGTFAANFPHLLQEQRQADARAAELEREQAAAAHRLALEQRRAERHAARHRSERRAAHHHASRHASSRRRRRRA